MRQNGHTMRIIWTAIVAAALALGIGVSPASAAPVLGPITHALPTPITRPLPAPAPTVHTPAPVTKPVPVAHPKCWAVRTSDGRTFRTGPDRHAAVVFALRFKHGPISKRVAFAIVPTIFC